MDLGEKGIHRRDAENTERKAEKFSHRLSQIQEIKDWKQVLSSGLISKSLVLGTYRVIDSGSSPE